jgi:uncharacterized iron-regulated membrane protein
MKFVRSVVFWLHLTMGCVAGLVIFTMSVTGVLLAYERQISNWINTPTILQSQSNTSTQESLDSILATLNGNGLGIPSDLVLHSGAKAPIEARYGRERTFYLNPWTAAVIGKPSETARKFFATVEQIHRSVGMGMQSPSGRGTTGASNLIFLFILISGSYLWLPKIFTAASFKVRLLFRRGLKGKAREWNWHHTIGAWTVVPLFFIVLSGVVMSYPWASNMLYKMTDTQPPVRGGRPGGPGLGRQERRPLGIAEQGGTPTFHSFDEVAMLAKQQVPTWRSITISVPAAQERRVNVSVDRSSGGHPEQVTQLVVNRQSGRIQSSHGFADNNAGQKLRAWARFLHTGEEFGVLGETIAALASLGGAFLVWTGISMAIRRMLVVSKGAAEPTNELQSI